MQPPAQELQARDLHDNVWTFRHIYRGKGNKFLFQKLALTDHGQNFLIFHDFIFWGLYLQ